MSKIGISKEALKEMIRDNVKMLYRKALEKATVEEIYQAAAFTVRDIISENWIKTHDEYYEKDETGKYRYRYFKNGSWYMVYRRRPGMGWRS